MAIDRKTPRMKRLPNLIVIGVAKAGTSSLFEYLGRHPDVGLSDVKEVRYFTPLRHGEQVEPVDSYAEHFAHIDQRYAVEATPGYFYGGLAVALPMRALCAPQAVLSLREPVSRCWSWYRFEKSRMRLPKTMTFDEYVERCMLLRTAGRESLPENKTYWGIGGGCYDRWLADWLHVFSGDLKVLFFDDLTRDPEGTMKELFYWLGLDPGLAELSDLQATNVTESYRVKAAQKVAVGVNRRGEGFFRDHPRAKQILRWGYYALNRPSEAEVMSETARRRLREVYRPHNQRLARQLDKIGLALPPGWET